MDQFTREIIGFAVNKGDLNSLTICCMFNKVISNRKPPKYLSTDHDPLFRFHRWKANLRILGIEEIKTVPYSPTSHPFIERLIGSARREYLDHLFFWNERDLAHKLEQFKQYYNNKRAHSALNRATPIQKASATINNIIPIDNYRWKSTASNLFQLPIAV